MRPLPAHSAKRGARGGRGKGKAAPEQSGALEHALGVLLVKGQQNTGGLADASHRQANAPHLALVLQAELADELHLIVETLLLEGTARRAGRLAMVPQEGSVRHFSLAKGLRDTIDVLGYFPLA